MVEPLETRKLMSATASASPVTAADDPAPRTALISDASGTDGVPDVTVIGAPQVVFTLTLSIPVSESESPHPSIRVTTHDGTAKAREDYRALDVVVPLFQFTNQNFLSTTVAVDIIGDFDDEPTETFTVTLSDPVGVAIADGEAVATIVNAPAPTPIKFGGADGLLKIGGVDAIEIRGPGSGLAYKTLESINPQFIQFDGTTKATTLRIAPNVVLPDVRVNGDMKSFGAKNVDLAGVVTFNGNVAKITFDDVADSRIVLNGAAPVSLVADKVEGLRLDATGPVKSIRVGDWAENTGAAVEENLITTPALGTVSSGGAFGVDVTADTIGRVTARGNLSGIMRATQSIGSVSAGSIVNAAVFAGASNDFVVGTLPDDAADFVNPAASIGSVTAHAPTRTPPGGVGVIGFINSDIAAPTVGSVKLGKTAAPSDGSKVSGVAAHSIRSLSATTSDDNVTLRSLDTPSESKTFDEFVVRVI
jgi:hypothetical protein